MAHSIMKKKFPLYIFGLIYPLSALTWASGTAGDDGKPLLWKQAVIMMEAQKKMVPRYIETRSEVLDRKGRADQVTQQWLELLDDGKGGYRQELRKAMRDGRDVTQKTLADIEKKKSKKIGEEEDEKSMSFNLGDTPLNPDEQHRVKVTPMEQRQKISGRTCVRFDFVMKGVAESEKKSRLSDMKGMVWIDENAGCPVKVEFTQDPLPRFAKKFWTIHLFGTDSSGAWVVREARIEGEGGILFIRKGFRATMKFSDYWVSTDGQPKNDDLG